MGMVLIMWSSLVVMCWALVSVLVMGVLFGDISKEY